MKRSLLVFALLALVACDKKPQTTSLEDTFNSSNQNTSQEVQKALSDVYTNADVDYTQIPVGLYTFYEVTNQIQSPTNSILIADFETKISGRREDDTLIHYNVTRNETYYGKNNDHNSKSTDDEFAVPKGISSQSIRALSAKSASPLTFHNLKVDHYQKPVPKAVGRRGNCDPCELEVTKISVDIFDHEQNDVEHLDWEIATNMIGFISSDVSFFDGTISRCSKKWINVDDKQNVFFSQCSVLRDYGIKQPNP